MKTAKQIAQWVIDNRYPKSENDKISDVEMYYELVKNIENLCNTPPVINCETCKHREVSKYIEPCNTCNRDYSNYQT
jgi:hypothetical protein